MDGEKREEIRGQAKKILANFAKSLEKVKFKEKAGKKEVGGFREEREPSKQDADFRKRVFDNFRIKDSESARESTEDSRHAPNKDEDCIIAEKAKW